MSKSRAEWWHDYCRLVDRYNDLLITAEKLEAALDAYHTAVSSGICSDPVLWATAEILYKEAKRGSPTDK